MIAKGYILKGRKADAEKALRMIHRGEKEYDPSAEIKLLEEERERELEHLGHTSWLGMMRDPIERKKIMWSAGAMYSQQICGILFFYVYGVVFAQAIGISQPFTIQLITNVLQIFAVAFAVLSGNKIRRRTNLLVTTSIMLVAFLIIGGIGTNKTLSRAHQYVIVVFSYIVIVAFNIGLGPLAYTVAREMAVGPNQNKIMSTSIVFFYFITWVVSFTAPYLYYDAGLGPMLGFVYAGTTLTSLLYCYFCVGETKGRTSMEIGMLLSQGVPARHWREHDLGLTDVPAEVHNVDVKEKA